MMLVSNPPSEAAVAESERAPLTLRRPARSAVLDYHELSPAGSGYRYALSCRQLEEHLEIFFQLRQRAGGAGPLVFSFDDGHISNYTHALPLLEKYSCKAIFFVIVGRIGQQKDFMTWNHVQELASLGHQVQSHSWSHQFLTECSDCDLREELVRSRETIEDHLGAPVHGLSAPHGRWDRRVLRACASAGYRRLYTSDPWSLSLGALPVRVIGRLIMVQSMDGAHLLNWLTMGRATAGLYRSEYVLKRSAQRVLGKKLYYRLWARFSGWNGPEDTELSQSTCANAGEVQRRVE